MGISGQQCFDVPSFFLQKIGLADSHVNHVGKIKGHRGVAKTIIFALRKTLFENCVKRIQ